MRLLFCKFAINRLYEEIKDFFGLSLGVPSTDRDLIQDLPVWLALAGSQEKCIIVFDALNQLDDGSGESKSIFWPLTFFANLSKDHDGSSVSFYYRPVTGMRNLGGSRFRNDDDVITVDQ